MIKVTLDSSVIIAALLKQEKNYEECFKLLEKIKNGEVLALEPYTVLVEIIAAIRRRTKSKELALRIQSDIQELSSFTFLDLYEENADNAAKIAAETGVRGMDAIVVQAAKENGCILISLDEEMIEKVKGIVEIKDVSELI